jgi:hypothetical protein
VLPTRIDRWSLTSVQQRLVKIGGRSVKHARYYWRLLAESHLTRRLFGRCYGESGPCRSHQADGQVNEERQPEARHQSGEVSEQRGGTEPIRSISGRDGSRLWVQGVGESAIREPLTAGSRGCSIRVFGEGKLEIPGRVRAHSPGAVMSAVPASRPLLQPVSSGGNASSTSTCCADSRSTACSSRTSSGWHTTWCSHPWTLGPTARLRASDLPSEVAFAD